MSSSNRTRAEFLVEMRTTVPPGTNPEAERDARNAEARRVAELAATDAVLRLWRTVDSGGEFTVGLWRATDEIELQDLLTTLPLFPWMGVVVRPLTAHPNDPRRTVRS